MENERIENNFLENISFKNAEGYKAKKNYEQAINEYKKCVELYPNEDLLKKILQRTINEQKKASDNLWSSAKICLKNKDYDNAFIKYKKSIEINPNDRVLQQITKPSLREIAEYYSEKELFQESIECYSYILRMFPNDETIIAALEEAKNYLNIFNDPTEVSNLKYLDKERYNLTYTDPKSYQRKKKW